MASIIVVSGKSRGNYLPLGEASTVIGRDEQCAMQVMDDLASRKHLEIQYASGDDIYTAKDLDSANGVLINGIRISESQQLHDKDVILIGESKLVYTAEDFLDGETAMQFAQRGEHEKDTLMQ